jgi:hypothetical protein
MMNDLETVGNVQISTAVKKYGAGSIYIPGGGANAFIPPSPNFDMRAGNFTIECWVYNISIAANYPAFISSVTGWSAGASGHRFNNAGAANKYTFHLNGAGDPYLTSTNTFSFNTWYHYALTRSGNTFRMFINGVLEATGTSYTGNYNPALGGMRLGYSQWDGTNGYYNGYIDDLRITKGAALYTANFTPPVPEIVAPTYVANNINATNDITTNSSFYPVFVVSPGTDTPAKVSTSKFSFNPSTGLLTVVSIAESSSIVLKENLVPITDVLDNITQLQAYTYDRKDGSKLNEPGLIAEEVDKILPNVISYIDNKPAGINYTKLTVYLIEAVKALKEEINKLK